MTPQMLGKLARAVLEAEVSLTPKPGLVDRRNNGAHDDMDFPLFLCSAKALEPWFCYFAELGRKNASLLPSDLFALLREPGRQAEQCMFAATKGVNTHKGAIFSLGLLCAAGGRHMGNGQALSGDSLCQLAAHMTVGLCGRELSDQAFRYGATGARGEAESGFASVRNLALPRLKGYLRRNFPLEECCLRTLLHLMAEVLDTNVLSRGGPGQASWVREQAYWLLCRFSIEGLIEFDNQLILRNISPGGCADLIAVTLFLWALDTQITPQMLKDNIPIIR